MPTWPTHHKYIGQSTTRVDGAAKVSGRARYSSDIQADGWLYGMILRSKWPAAKILAVDLEPARKLPGIKAALVVRDAPFTIRYYGEEIAAVAGTSKQSCLDALRAIVVKAEPKDQFVVSEDEMRASRIPPVSGKVPKCLRPEGARDGQCGLCFS